MESRCLAIGIAIGLACGLASCWSVSARADDIAPVGDGAVAAPGEQTRPLWEAGVGVFVGTLADYPGSDHYQVRGLPLPYFIYRGDVFRADQSGPRLRAAEGNVEWELSGGGTLSSTSQSGARSGLPKLDYLLEVGPKAKITIARPTPTSRVIVDVPIRAAYSTNFSSRFDERGFVFAPDIAYEDRAVFGTQWNARISLGAEAATKALQQFYYEVQPQYVTTGRAAFQARAGYLGSDLSVSAFRSLAHNFNVFVAVDLDDYKGAANQDSPLFRTSTGVGVALGFTWSFAQSKEQAAGAY